MRELDKWIDAKAASAAYLISTKDRRGAAAAIDAMLKFVIIDKELNEVRDSTMELLHSALGTSKEEALSAMKPLIDCLRKAEPTDGAKALLLD